MNGKFTLAQIRIFLMLGAILLIGLTYFLGFQKNMEKASQYEQKTDALEKRITELEVMQVENADLEVFTSLYTDDMEAFIQSFPVKLTQQKSIYLLYRMMIGTGIDIQSITPNEAVPFYYKGQVLTSEGDRGQASEQAAQEPLSEIVVVDMEQMVGSTSSYSVNLSGTTAQIYKTLDWITEHSEKMSVGDVNLQFDSSTGKLNGSISVNFYCMLGNGVPYKEPNLDAFAFGVDNVFGEFLKK